MITVSKIAEEINGKIYGNSSLPIMGIKPLESACFTDISFLEAKSKKEQAKLLELAKNSKAAAILVTTYDPQIQVTQIETTRPLHAVMKISALFARSWAMDPGIHPSAIVHTTAEIGENVCIGAYSVIGPKVKLDANVTIYPHVVIYEGAVIGERSTIHSSAVIREGSKIGADCIIQNGVVIGGDGFGYSYDPKHGHIRIPHIGHAVLGDRVEVGANSTIDRAMLDATRIGEGTKIDNLVMIGHNNQIGKDNIFCAQVGISGSCTIGDGVVLAGQAGVADHIHIASGTRAAAQTGITSDIPSKIDVMGYPARPAQEQRRTYVALTRISELFSRVRKLEKILAVNDNDQ